MWVWERQLGPTNLLETVNRNKMSPAGDRASLFLLLMNNNSGKYVSFLNFAHMSNLL